MAQPFFKLLTGFLTLITLTLAPLSMAKADRVIEAEALIDQLVIESLALVNNTALDQAGREEEINRLLDSYFDFETITRASTGQYWRAASQDEKARYADLFKNVLVRSLAGQLDQLTGLTYQADGHVPKGDKMLLLNGVVSDPAGNQADIILSWRLATLPDKPVRVIDVQVENISMLKTQQQENKAIIRKGGGKFAALITALEDQAKALKQ